MATTKTAAKTNTTVPVEMEGPDIHHMVRTVGAVDNVEHNVVGPDAADAQVRTWLEQGFTLAHAVSLGNADAGGQFAVRILYILTKPAVSA